MSRRRVILASAGAGVVGGFWGAGLTLLAQGRHPQVFVLGNDLWQVVLAEHGGARIVFLCGSFTSSPAPTIDHALSAIRQRIDVVVGSVDALAYMPSAYLERRRVTHVVALGAGAGSSRSVTAVVDPVQVTAGDIGVRLDPLPSRLWEASTSGEAPWVGAIEIGGAKFAISPSAESAATHAPADASLVITPVGDPDLIWRALPSVAVAMNGSSTREWTSRADPAEDGPRYLVRTFARDIATFRCRDGRIELPDWAQAFGGDGDAGSPTRPGAGGVWRPGSLRRPANRE